MNWMLRIAGFAAGLVVVFALEVAFFELLSASTGRHWYPRGAGWLLMPIAAGVFGALLAERYGRLLSGLVGNGGQSKTFRLCAIGSALWALAVACYLFIFDPLGSYWSSNDWAFVWKLVLVPPAFCFIAVLAISTVMKPPAGPTAP